MKISLIFLYISLATSLFGQWNQIGQIIYGDEEDLRLGEFLAISANGSIIGVSVPGYDGGYDDGLVEIYQFDGENWFQLGHGITDYDNKFHYGGKIDFNDAGNIIALAGRKNFDEARIYKFEFGSWTLMGDEISGSATGSYKTQISLSASGEIVAIGAKDTDRVRIFQFIDNEWQQLGEDIEEGTNNKNTGTSIGLSDDGHILVVGCDNTDTFGEVMVFEYNGTDWELMGEVIEGSEAQGKIGRSVCINGSGDRIAIGYRVGDEDEDNSGQIKSYAWNGSSWEQIGETMHGEDAHDYLGEEKIDMSRDGNTIVAGAKHHSVFDPEVGFIDYAGHVKVFKFDGTDWNQVGINIDGIQESESFGACVVISADGNTFLTSAKGFDDGVRNASGRAQVFSLSNVGVKENSLNQSISIYPNPFSDVTSIDFGRELVTGEIVTIFDSLGKEVYRNEKVTGQKLHFTNNSLVPGIYFLSVISDKNQTTTIKLIVQ